MSPLFRKKPVVIAAQQVPIKPASLDLDEIHMAYLMDLGAIAVFMGAGGPWTYADDGGIDIETLEGVMHASQGDWIIKGIHGEFYPCKPDIFEKTYDRVE